MAIDTAQKRRGITPPFLALPIPDGTVEEADRRQVSLIYSGPQELLDTMAKYCFDVEWNQTYEFEVKI